MIFRVRGVAFCVCEVKGETLVLCFSKMRMPAFDGTIWEWEEDFWKEVYGPAYS